MSEQIALVTGATGGIGRVIVTGLARAGARVVAVVRDQERGERLRADIIAAHGSSEVEVLVGDLERQADVRAVAAQLHVRHDRLDVRVNNAGAHFRQQEIGSDGIERDVAVNHLAGFLLTDLLLPTIRATANATSSARIVDVVSDALNDTRTVKIGCRSRPATIDPDHLGEVDHARPMHAYARSKLATLKAATDSPATWTARESASPPSIQATSPPASSTPSPHGGPHP
jgi:NAD(P)-dependent dehydrogenase (short-subunit alcohol dehydrogenase family)